jgi:undecaprenyl-diphosphatase
VANWGYLAAKFRSLLFSAIASIAIIGIGLSRILLGAHYPHDVLGGWLIGLVLLIVYLAVEQPVGRWIGRQSLPAQSAFVLAAPLVLVFLHPADVAGQYPAEAAVTSMSALAGLGLGVIMERRWVQFRVAAPWWRLVLRFLAGLALVAVVYFGPRLALANRLFGHSADMLRAARYVALGWTVAFLVPWVFVQLGLAERLTDG